MKRLVLLAAVWATMSCAQAPVCTYNDVHFYSVEQCLELAELQDDEECFTDSCCEMDDMAYFEATGRVRR